MEIGAPLQEQNWFDGGSIGRHQLLLQGRKLEYSVEEREKWKSKKWNRGEGSNSARKLPSRSFPRSQTGIVWSAAVQIFTLYDWPLLNAVQLCSSALFLIRRLHNPSLVCVNPASQAALWLK